MFAGSLLLVVLAHTLLTTAQTTNATCAPSHEWAFNSKQQSPCLVASSLLAVCTGSYEVYALPEQYHYDAPDMQDANPCQCNTVVYSLLAECGLCQNRTTAMWSVWETNCASVSIGSFPKPIPAGLHVPGWAYLDVKATDMFNEALAEANANITESTAVPESSQTSASASASSSAAPQATTDSPSSDVSAPVVNQTRSNAIGGGIVGGFALLLLVCGLGFWIYRRRRTARANGGILNSPVMSQYHTDTQPSQPTAPVPSITVSSLNSQSGSASILSGQNSV
ncbi:hypothetical protein B0H17DRAFT_234305 [Mycena rosella]|uniref:Mid2 domain-containing protein n=1 Tax=Mycena rosella TaxID=1033263 RepID=A0AAD7MC58_MYCRO|nr:hypothetical protein B0H17DRAFT_234305 [Mycena rosella]